MCLLLNQVSLIFAFLWYLNWNGAVFNICLFPLVDYVAEFAGILDEKKEEEVVPKFMAELLENIADFVFSVSFRGCILCVSASSARSLLGFESKVMVGQNLSDFLHPSDLVAVMREFRTAEDGKNLNFICRFRRKDKTYVYVDVSGHLHTSKKKTRYFIMSGRGRYFIIANLPADSIPRSGENAALLKLSVEGLVLHSSGNIAELFGPTFSTKTPISLFDIVPLDQHDSLRLCLNKFKKPSSSAPPELDVKFPLMSDEASSRVFAKDTTPPSSGSSAAAEQPVKMNLFIPIQGLIAELELQFVRANVVYCSTLYCIVRLPKPQLSPNPPTQLHQIHPFMNHTLPYSQTSLMDNVLQSKLLAQQGQSPQSAISHISPFPMPDEHSVGSTSTAMQFHQFYPISDLNAFQLQQTQQLSTHTPLATSQQPASTESLFSVFDENSNTSLMYEMNRLKALNKRLAEEIQLYSVQALRHS